MGRPEVLDVTTASPPSSSSRRAVSQAGFNSGVPESRTGVLLAVACMEAALGANFSADAIKSVKIAANDMISDLHGDADYRAHLVGVMARRAVARANEFSAGEADEAAPV